MSGNKILFKLLFILIICKLDLYPQNKAENNLLTIDRLFNSNEFRLERLSPIQWLNNGASYSYLKISADLNKFHDIMIYDIIDQEDKMVVGASDLIPEGAKDPLEIESYQWSNDEKKILIFTNSRRVWRTNTRGDYWVYDLQNRKLRRIGADLPESSLMFAKFSPDQQKIAYLSEFNIYVEDLGSGEVKQLTNDGNRDLINGTFDWAYEEEFDCKDGFRWSNDGESIAYWQIDASEIKNFFMINNTDSVYSYVVPLQYPKVGENPSAAKIGVVNIYDNKTVWLKIPGDQKQNYIPRMQWIGSEILVQQLNRKQNNLKYYLCNKSNGEARLIFEEKENAWIDIMNPDISSKRRGMDDLLTTKDLGSFLYLTEKDGWKHIYNISLNSGEERLISSGQFDIASIYDLYHDQDGIYVSASPDNSTQRYLYHFKLKENDKGKRITPLGYQGVNAYNISPNGKYAIHEFSSANNPPIAQLVSLPDHKVLKTLINNDLYRQKVELLGLPQYEFFKVTTIEGVTMDGKILKPNNFDPSQKYPVLFYVYGEPWSQTVVDSWKFGWEQLLVQKGYIIISLDNRGTPALKGREWRKSIYKNIGIINSHDQAMGAKEILKWDFVDKDRIAVWGWSGGGSMTLNLMFRYPEVYKTGIAVAFVANQLYYDNIYQERYMGLPSENMEAFIEGSPITYAKNLEGNLLLIHGTGDDNVHYQNAEALINELIKHNKQFQVMPYPNRSHGIYEGENTTRHLYTLMTNYLLQHCPPGPLEK